MRLRNIKGAREKIAESSYTIDDPLKCKGNWKEVFGNDNPVRIEVGCGKGRFIMDLAEENPEVNYVGIEKYSSVLLRALQKQEERELTNVRFIRMEAEIIAEVFEKEEADRIYLNFSDPWPKERHAQRRLTSASFLARYDQILKKDGQIEFKTDNRDLFDFSLTELNTAGWHAEAVTFDLHADKTMNEGNIMTEYEERFSAKGNPIFKYIIKR